MINQQLLNPQSIVIVGGSNDTHKPGGTIIRNLVNGGYKGALRVINPKEDEVQGIKAVHTAAELPQTDMAILVVAAKFCPQYVEELARDKGVRAFIIISAGFGEETHEGLLLEEQVLATCERYQCALIGPNCIGVMNNNFHGIFTLPIPQLNPKGADFITGSGATAVFILESAVMKGLPFNSVWSIGNGKQNGIEDVLAYLDETFDPERDSHVKLLYAENISHPDRLLKHARSLIRKGCRIAAIKAGASESGSRAASSHTGAIATSDSAVEALFRKAGIVRCHSREELTTVGCVFCTLEQAKAENVQVGRNYAIVTHAGGPGVMLTDGLSKGGMNVPKLEGPAATELKGKLFPGASVANPIDILATGTPEHLGIVLDYCDQRMDDVDAICVIYGTPGLVELWEAYDVLDKKMAVSRKPIFPILPSMNTAAAEVKDFIAKGHMNFSDEVTLANALALIRNTPAPADEEQEVKGIDAKAIRAVIDKAGGDAYLEPADVRRLLQSAAIPVVPELVSDDKELLMGFADGIGYPVVAKVVGPLHKSDVGGVVLNVMDAGRLATEFDRLMGIKDATAVMVQKQTKGTELFIGAKFEPRFGHSVLCGLGGIFVEVLKDVATGLAPLSHGEATRMIESLRGYKILKGVRGQAGINVPLYADILVRISRLLVHAPEIKEMDINPLLADGADIVAVDARIRVVKE